MWYDNPTDCMNYLAGISLYEDVLDVSALQESNSLEIDNLKKLVKQTVNNLLFEDMDLEGVRRWESIFQLPLPLDTGLLSRIDNIRAKLLTQPPINLAVIKRIVEAFLGVKVEVFVKNYILYIRYRGRIISIRKWADVMRIYQNWKDVREDSDTWENVMIRGFVTQSELEPLYEMLYQIIPANLQIDFSYRYATWYEVMNKFATWSEVKNTGYVWLEVKLGVWNNDGEDNESQIGDPRFLR